MGRLGGGLGVKQGLVAKWPSRQAGLLEDGEAADHVKGSGWLCCRGSGVHLAWAGGSQLGARSCRLVVKHCARLGRSSGEAAAWDAELWAGGEDVGLIGRAVG